MGMNKPGEFRSTVDEMLGGLTASQKSYQKIMHAGRGRASGRAVYYRRLLPAVMALVFVLGGAYMAFGRETAPQPTLATLAAGEQMENARQFAFAVPRGSVSLNAGSGAPAYQGLWAAAKGANFPMIAVQNRYYRMLKNPTAIDADMLGSSLGQVDVNTDEPALSDASSHVISNVAEEGTDVYSVSGMDGAAVAAMVNGSLRVFQRVSFSGNALVGSEGLSSTLGGGRPVALQLSGVGTVTDPADIDTLMGLLSGASFKSAAAKSAKQALLIEYDNHIVLQMAVKGNDFIACGTWSCPDFISAFAGMAK